MWIRGRFSLHNRHDSFPKSVEEPMALPGGGGGGGGGGDAQGTCASACLCSDPASVPSATWHRSLKRKLDERDGGARFVSCVSVPIGNNKEGPGAGLARVDIENEAAALREALASHKQSVQELLTELEEERNASASATMEAMSMILRLQREKAEAQMEARQFKRLADEKMAHDQQEIATLEDLLFKRDQAVQALACEVQAYRHRLLSYGIAVDGDAPPSEPQTPDTATSACTVSQFDPFLSEYPPLRCSDDSAADLDMYPSAETPRENIYTPQPRIPQLERLRTGSFRSFKDKVVVVGSPRRRPRHLRSFSYGSFGSFNKGEEFPAADCSSECDTRDDMSDRVYTVDAVHGASENYVGTPREIHGRRGIVGGEQEAEAEIKKLYLRLQALEADRESMRQTLISMSTDKAQMALLKDIAQEMCKEKEVPTDKRVVKKQSSFKKISVMSMFKSIISFVFWRKRSCRVKYTFGLSASNSGLLLLLDKSSPRMRHRRLLNKAQG